MKLKILIVLDNAAFDPDPDRETSRILHELADDMRGKTLAPGKEFHLQDVNGNLVGKAKVEP